MEENNNLNTEETANVQPVREMKDYESISERLNEIEHKISSEDVDMEESLKLYEEAVNLGMKASETIENNVLANVADDAENDQNEDIDTEQTID